MLEVAEQRRKTSELLRDGIDQGVVEYVVRMIYGHVGLAADNERELVRLSDQFKQLAVSRNECYAIVDKLEKDLNR